MNHAEVRDALRARLLTVASLPAARVFENETVNGLPFTPTPGVPYLAERYAPATSQLLGLGASLGAMEDRGLYVITWFVPKGSGRIDAQVADVLAAFPAGLAIPLPSGAVLRIRGDQAPVAGQLIPLEHSSFAYQQMLIPWRVEWTAAVL